MTQDESKNTIQATVRGVEYGVRADGSRVEFQPIGLGSLALACDTVLRLIEDPRNHTSSGVLVVTDLETGARTRFPHCCRMPDNSRDEAMVRAGADYAEITRSQS